MRACRMLIAGGFTAMMAVILVVLCGNVPMGALPAAMAVLLGLCVLLRRERGRRLSKAPWLLFAFLFIAQAYLSFHAYFLTGWDVKTILESAYAIAGGEGLIDHYYYSLYPNNACLTLLFAAVIRMLRLLLGNPGLDRCVYVLILLQCALNTLAGLITWRLARRLADSEGFALLAALVYGAFVGLSPWLMIPYSDSMALIFPVAILAVYQHQQGKKLAWGHWLLIGLLTAVGYMIKPQAAIVTIAIGIIEVLRLMQARRVWALAARGGCVLLCVGVLSGPAMDWATAQLGILVRPGRAMGMAHFAMMGLSERTGGQYDDADLALSVGVEDPKARRQMQLEEIGRRLEEMGPSGLLDHLRRKTVINYGDGLFAWAGEGNFFAEMIAEKDETLSPLLRDMIGCGEAKRYPAVRAYFQGIWLALLIGALGMLSAVAESKTDQRQDLTLAMMLSVIGLTFFELLFEARARYLFAYAPVYVLLGLCGLWTLVDALSKRRNRR